MSFEMKPTKEYNGRSRIRMYRADCMEFMKSKPENHWELSIVDPPYGINVKTRVFDNNKNWDNETPNKEYFNILMSISKNQIIWGANYFLNYLPPTKCFVVWDKKMTEKHMMSMAELAWTSFDTKSLIFKQPPCGDRGFYNIDGARIHPTQKSIKLYKWLLTNYAKEGDTILDTHGGSMSIAIACWDLGFDLDVCELDTDYFNDAVKRFENHISQTQLF